MSIFTSLREKRLWLCVLVVLIAIFATLFIGQPLAKTFVNQDLQAAFFLLGMFFVGVAIITHGLITKPSKVEIAILLGFAAVYIMLYLRLGIAERSHLIEYSVLAICLHKAITERIDYGKQMVKAALIALLVAVIIGVIDEYIQIFIPNRVFDPIDILFNTCAALVAIGASLLLSLVKHKLVKHLKKRNN